MDGAAYLRKHGWQGSGFSLNPENSRALKKPLLVSRKVDVLGVGLNKNDSVSDQWWLRAFDSSLKALGTGQKGALDQVREHGVKRGGLYGRFVKGQDIPGTLGGRDKEIEASHEASSLNTSPATRSKDTVNSLEPASMVTKRKYADTERDHDAKRPRVDHGPNGEVSMTAEQRPVELLPGEKGYKAQKYAREAAKRQAKRDAKAAAAKLLIDPNETTIQRIARIKRERGIEKQAKQEKTKRREEKQKIKADLVLARRAAKKARKDEVKARKQRIAAIMAEEDRIAAEKRKAEMGADGVDQIEGNTDFVSLQPPRKYPTAAQKRETKARAMAIERGVSVETIKAEQQRAAEVGKEVDKELTDEKRAAKLGLDMESYASLSESSWPNRKRIARELRDLDSTKKAKYEERASKKGQHVLVYYISRVLKKDAAEAERDAEARAQSNGLGFVVDEAGDAFLGARAEQAKELLKGKNKDLTMPPQQVWALLDPKMWEDKIVRELPKDIRELRRIWMRTRRRLRKEEEAQLGVPAKRSGHIGADGKTKDQRKIEKQEHLMHSILKYSRRVKFGGPPEGSEVVHAEPEDAETKAARERATQSGSEFIPLDPKLLENPNPNLYVPKGPVEAPPLGPNNEPYPVVNVAEATGKYSLLEMKIARRQARRMLRHEKQSRKRGNVNPNAEPVISRRDRFRKRGKTA